MKSVGLVFCKCGKNRVGINADLFVCPCGERPKVVRYVPLDEVRRAFAPLERQLQAATLDLMGVELE